MATNVTFLAGNKLSDKELEFQPGTFYLDLEKNELYFDSPTDSKGEHLKIVDQDTLIHQDIDYEKVENAYVYRGKVSEKDKTPIEDVSAGDLYTVNETNKSYVATIAWSSLGSTLSGGQILAGSVSSYLDLPQNNVSQGDIYKVGNNEYYKSTIHWDSYNL